MHPFLRILIIFGTSICIFGCGFAWAWGMVNLKYIRSLLIWDMRSLFIGATWMMEHMRTHGN